MTHQHIKLRLSSFSGLDWAYFTHIDVFPQFLIQNGDISKFLYK